MINKKTFLVITLCCFFQHFYAQRFDASFVMDSVKREFIISKPSGAVPAGGYPIVMVLHGTTGDGEKFYNISGWKELGEKEKIITIYPSSLSYCVIGELGFKVNETKWNNGDLQMAQCPNLIQNLKDDVKFLRKVIDTVQKTFAINSKMIFLTGFSNGSVMSNKMSIEASDVFSAVASCGGALFSLDSSKPKRYIPVWQTIGTNDEHFYVFNHGNALPFNDSLKLLIPYFGKTFLGAFNLDTTYTVVKNANLYSFTYTKTKSASQKNYFYYSFMKDLDHAYPNGVNYVVSAPIIFWEFFKQAVATTPIETISTSDYTIKAYPNPSENKITIDLLDKWKNNSFDIEVFNILGERVLHRQYNNVTLNSIKINKTETGTGLFYVVLNNHHDKLMTKIIFN